MVWIKAKNGNVINVPDVDHAAQLLNEGHEAFVSDPRGKGATKAWKAGDPDPEAVEDEGSDTPGPS